MEKVTTEFAVRVSVIVPVYNQEPYLEKAVASLISQSMPSSDFEILLIDDGSTDRSAEMCDEYASRYDNVRVIHKENGGLSDARNCGIDHARGRYLMYLDGDDTLREDTILRVANFFDRHYDEIDLVTYPSYKEVDGQEAESHYRYKVLTHTGIYDLTDEANIYAAVTRIEVCVKNRGERNVRFSSDRNFRHEDQKYCTDVILDKLKIGYVEAGGYQYRPNENGLLSNYFYAYYLFEPTMSFWEEEFGKFENEVPQYLQALYISDIAWKLRAAKLLPYHYSEDEFNRAKSRVVALLDRVDNSVIINHPAIDKQQRYFWVSKKTNSKMSLRVDDGLMSLYESNELVYSNKKIEITLRRTVPTESGLRLIGYIKNPCLRFAETVRMSAIETVGDETKRSLVELKDSSWDYYKAKNKVTKTYAFEYSCNTKTEINLRFEVELDGGVFPTNYYFATHSAFSKKGPKRYTFYHGCYRYSYENASFTIQKLSPKTAKKEKAAYERAVFKKNGGVWLYRYAASRIKAKGRRIWLYHDCHGVEKNNAYYQFLHDFGQDDGVERYYVVNDSLDSKRHLFSKKQMENVIAFQSKQHRVLFLAAEKIITAYIERNNWVAFNDPGMKNYTDVFNAEIVYLQHGVLHATLPWKYSFDRMQIDKEVVSTHFEIVNLSENYHFPRNALIEAGMPRYDFIDAYSVPKKRILLAPSWRKYLVHQNPDGQWSGVQKAFVNSNFYKELDKLLHDKRLDSLLEETGYTLDVKLHPILAELYQEAISTNSEHINIAGSSVRDEEYAVFITDFSSYRFDFVYLKRAIAYFFPDEDMFKSGMCDYRQNDLPLEGQFGDMARTASELVDLLKGILEDGGKPKDKYLKQMDGFFLHYDNEQCSRIYSELI